VKNYSVDENKIKSLMKMNFVLRAESSFIRVIPGMATSVSTIAAAEFCLHADESFLH
jgi:hypothetical protein